MTLATPWNIYLFILPHFSFVYMCVHAHTHTHTYTCKQDCFKGGGVYFHQDIHKCLVVSHNVMFPYLYALSWRRQWHPTPVLLPGKIPWTEEPGRLQSLGSLKVRHDWVTSLLLLCIGEGNGNPLQCSYLENPRDRRAWWAAVYGVAQSRTRLKQLSSSSSSIDCLVPLSGFINALETTKWIKVISLLISSDIPLYRETNSPQPIIQRKKS